MFNWTSVEAYQLVRSLSETVIKQIDQVRKNVNRDSFLGILFQVDFGTGDRFLSHVALSKTFERTTVRF